ncbi:MAG: DUF5011 domain-containing protein [Bacteroidetes bacterium]|jgi:hypothetical protein|nr:DUF5011 domain-containing protein [Bacteroidota bacterium]
MKNTLFTLLLSLALFNFVNAQNIDSFTVSNPLPYVCDTVELINLSTNYTSLTWEISGGSFLPVSDFPYGTNPKIRFGGWSGCRNVKLIVGRGSVYDTIEQICAIKAFDSISLYVIGNKIDTVDVHTNYYDSGFVATSYCSGIDPSKSSTTGNVNINVVGKYIITYVAFENSGYSDSAQRIVYVVDRVAPTISLYGYDTTRIEVFCQFIDPGFSVADNYCTFNEMELYTQTNLDTSSIGTYFIDYTVVDLDSNYATVRRIVEVTNAQPPSLNSKTVYVEVYNSYFPDYVITHSCCDLAEIEVFYQSNVDTAKLGIYFTDIWLKDCHGNISDTITQTVNIVDRTPPILTWTGPDTFFIKQYKVLPPDFDTALHYWDNYDTALLFNHQKGTYYTTYLVNKAPGCYTVIFNATDNSGNKSNEITIWVCTTPSSIEDEKQQRNVHIYPNPNNGQFTIENKYPNQAIHSVSVFNQMGQEVYFKEIDRSQTGSIEIDINQSPGVYFIQAKSEKGITSSKFLIN